MKFYLKSLVAQLLYLTELGVITDPHALLFNVAIILNLFVMSAFVFPPSPLEGFFFLCYQNIALRYAIIFSV